MYQRLIPSLTAMINSRRVVIKDLESPSVVAHPIASIKGYQRIKDDSEHEANSATRFPLLPKNSPKDDLAADASCSSLQQMIHQVNHPALHVIVMYKLVELGNHANRVVPPHAHQVVFLYVLSRYIWSRVVI